MTTFTDSTESLIIPLPDEIAAFKGVGDLAAEDAAIDRWLKKPVDALMRRRLLLEKEFIRRYPASFPYTEAEAVALAQKELPDFTVAELRALDEEGYAEWMYLNGEKHYIHNFFRNALQMSDDLHVRKFGSWADEDQEKAKLDDAIREMKEKGELAYRFELQASIRIKDEYFKPGMHVRVHLPIPAAYFQMENIQILDMTPGGAVGAEDQPARTVSFEETMQENHPFFVRYSYINHMKYTDPVSRASEARPLSDPEAFRDDLCETDPHIRFTPYLRALAAEIAGDETNPVLLAKRVYDYITTTVHYSYQRPYILFDQIPEYIAKNLRGDCGVQALLFITLCRILGIPAKWQSGLYTMPGETGCHDWAMFYAEPFGWMFADPSFGTSGYRRQNEARRAFYFGNLDPYRMCANHVFQADFTPARKFIRNDPYDSQTGEIETDDFGFTSDQLENDQELIFCEKID